jgi:hypothetical protein
MQRTGAIVVVLLTLAGPVHAADETPAQLVAALVQAAHNRDPAGFTAHLSLASKRALADAETARARQVRAQLGYQAALDERFGKGHAFPPPGPADRAALLSGMVQLDLIGVQTQTPTRALLQLRTTAGGPGDRNVAETDTLPAVREAGSWRLDLSGFARSVALLAAGDVSAYERTTHAIQAGTVKDRVAAVVALLQAERDTRVGAKGEVGGASAKGADR